MGVIRHGRLAGAISPPEYRRPERVSPGRHLERLLFLRTISEVLPAVPQALRDLVLAGMDPEAAIRSWAERYHLEDEWIVESARTSLPRWLDDEARERQRRKHEWFRERHPELNWRPATAWPWLVPAGRLDRHHFVDEEHVSAPAVEKIVEGLKPGVLWEGPRRTFSWAAWDPLQQRKSDYRREVLEAFTEELDGHLAEEEQRVQELVEAGVLEKVGAKRARSADRDLHFRWLVRFQVGEETLEAIAASEAEVLNRDRGFDSKAVAAACRELAKRIGLTRRSIESP